MRVRILVNTAIPGKNLFVGETHEVAAVQAKELIAVGYAAEDEELEVNIESTSSVKSKGKKAKRALEKLSDDELKTKAKELDIALAGDETREELIELVETFEDAE
ncbi:MAG: hypothetical protein LBP40_04700 [Campylobacteraceae bacterium]|jgi:hypothetical protein|nr:hypothetical protein [Campylobacteraceae bacterium]